MLANDRQWGAALQERLQGKRYAEHLHPVMGEWILAPESWEEVAKFVVGICQTQALNLSPWEYPPCRAGRDAFGNEALDCVIRWCRRELASSIRTR